MSRIVLVLVLGVILLASACGGGEPPRAGGGSVASTMPEAPDPSARYLIYLHGKIIEDQGPRPTHPRFGVYEYRQILDSFAACDLAVISQVRPAGTDPLSHARVVAGQVQSLLDAGVPPEHVTVAGFSKGGAIAILTSALLANDRVSFVFMACCGPWIDRALRDAGGEVSGRMLSLHEASDELGGSCRSLFATASPGSTCHEIELELGGGHGAFYRPHPEWVDPAVAWARGDLGPR